jgi:glycosyltransferase involved in cell wall biosynthesis
VLILTGEYPPQAGGVGDYTARLVAALEEQGHVARVLSSAVNGVPDELAPTAWRRIHDWGFGSWRKVDAALDRATADVLHIQYQAGAYQLKGAVHLLPFWLRRRRPWVRVVTTFHDLRIPYLFPKAGPLRGLAVRALLRGSHAAIFVDAADLAQVEAAPDRHWVPIGSNIPCAPPPGFSREATRRALGGKPGELLVGYFGFLTAGKGADTLLRALRLLLDAGRPARLALVGAGASASNPTDRADEAALETLIGELALEPYVIRTGFLAPPAVSAHLLACDLLALPYDDGASFRRGSLLAALEHGRPIVTTPPAPAARGLGDRTLESGRQFLAVPPRDPAALAEAMVQIANDRELGKRLGREARALAARCGWAAIAAETAEVYGCYAGIKPRRRT